MSSQYLALSPKFLSRLSYHPIWGLGLDRKGHKNFYEIVRELDANAELLEKITKETNKILNNRGLFGAIFRIFYWIFNINQYCHNYYKLQAYYSWRKYEDGIKMFSESKREDINCEGGFIERNDMSQSILSTIYDATIYCVEPVKWCVVTPIVWVAGGIRMIFFTQESQTSLQEVIISQDTHFTVDSQAQEYLEILGIKAEIDSQIAIIDVKKRYKKLCLAHHPDKGGDADRFRIITETYKNLENHISPDKDIFGLKEKFEEYFAEWRKEHEEADECIRSAAAATQSLSAATKSLSEETERAAEAVVASRNFREEYEKNSAAKKKKFEEDLEAIKTRSHNNESKSRYSPTMF